MDRTKGPATIRDVARLAGVSPSTVSKVMNGSTRISAQTRVRVEEAVRKLNFRPNSIARSLRKNHTLTIGMINNSSIRAAVFAASLMVGVEAVARKEGFGVLLCNTDGQEQREKDYLETLVDKQIDGVLFMGSAVRQRALPALDLGPIPHVFLYQYSLESRAPSIIPDDVQGGFTATAHLLELGHDRVAYINGALRHEASNLRLQGYVEAHERAGLDLDPQLVHQADSWEEDGGYQGTKHLMALTDPPSAIFCANDNLAVGALEALREGAFDVPGDVALVGFDNSLQAYQKRPPLTTVALPFEAMGKLAVGLLLQAIRGEPGEAIVHRVPCPLIQRRSCGPPRRRGSAPTARHEPRPPDERR